MGRIEAGGNKKVTCTLGDNWSATADPTLIVKSLVFLTIGQMSNRRIDTFFGGSELPEKKG